MPGRHATRGRRPRVWRTISLVLLVVSVPILSFVGVRALTLSTTGPENVAASTCEGNQRIRVAVAPEIGPPLEKIARKISEDRVAVDGKCLDLRIETIRPAEMYTALVEGRRPRGADLWIPDSLEWLRRADVPDDRLLTLSPSVAASPLILAAPESGAEQLRQAATDWERLALAGRPAVSDPEESAVTLSVLLGVKRALSDGEAPDPEQEEQFRRQMGRDIFALLRHKVGDLDTELEAAADGGLARPVPATEQQIRRLLQENPEADVSAVVPEEGTVLLDYPLVALVDTARSETVVAAGNALLRYAGNDAGRRALREAGFRLVPDLRPPPGPSVVGDVEVLPMTTLTDTVDVLRGWAAMEIGTRMLAIVDLSGSMAMPADEGRSRIELARDAAETALGYFPDYAEIGLWGFSVQRQGNQDHETFVPIGELKPPHRKALIEGLHRMPSEVGGGTGLYDTILAGYRAAQADYDPRRISSVVLLTDGRNEDDPVGIDKERLLSELERLKDPTRPVLLIFVGIGPEADVETLAQIAEVTGGIAYQALDPADMERIVIDALLRRQCTGDVCA